ncbi:TPA: hypothetical protein EYP70_04980 [Candidatus Bathyarchaeota archaeon]|nr:hypothetical protein [Candidatus Bathyarchaeota archaeon]
MRCKICGRETQSRFCNFHMKAYENLKLKYNEWREAMEISWEEYLRQIINNPLTGLWAKEVAQVLLKDEMSPKKRE